ncbi:MAG TPA: hypothetical protein VEJ16_03255 [Alphaproteobacteria bacterium]|nr:hypothetical protein [Alphaproteobacteria bacterium]
MLERTAGVLILAVLCACGPDLSQYKSVDNAGVPVEQGYQQCDDLAQLATSSITVLNRDSMVHSCMQMRGY